MNRQDIIDMIAKVYGVVWTNEAQLKDLERFAALVASAEREKLKGQIETLHAMFVLASKQRDELMDEQRAQVAVMRGKIQ